MYDCFGLEHDILSVYPYRQENIQEMLCHIYSSLEFLKKNGQIFDPDDFKKLDETIKEIKKKLEENKNLIDYVHQQLILHIDNQAQVNASVLVELKNIKERLDKIENGDYKPVPPPGPIIGPDCWKQGLISNEGFRFIKGWEAFAQMPYQDSTGHWTIGYGITAKYDPDEYRELSNELGQGKGCTETNASKKMYAVLVKSFTTSILPAVKAMGCDRQCQFDALVSLAYNKGASVVTGSNELTDVIRKNPNNEDAIRKAWYNFKVYPGTPSEQGLRNRRKAEVDMYFGVYGKRPINKLPWGSGYVDDNNGNGWLPDACNETPGPQPGVGRGRTICVDAGHALSGDPSGHAGEPQFTRRVRDILIPKLKDAGYKVVDCTVDVSNGELDQLQKVVAKVNKYPNAELYVSIHMNGYHDPGANGTETFTYQRASEKAKKYSRDILDGIVASCGTVKRGAKEQNFYVLRETICPAVLCEGGFLTNVGDSQKVTPEKYAEGIYNGIIKTV